MLRLLTNKRAQANSSEYVLVLFLIVGMITAMGLMFRRAVQARIHDARLYMFAEIGNRVSGHYNQFNNGIWPPSYEPYYVNTDSIISRRTYTEKHIRPSGIPKGTTGLFDKTVDEHIRVEQFSNVLAPSFSD